MKKYILLVFVLALVIAVPVKVQLILPDLKALTPSEQSDIKNLKLSVNSQIDLIYPT
jgi:hypothetical protein